MQTESSIDGQQNFWMMQNSILLSPWFVARLHLPT